MTKAMNAATLETVLDRVKLVVFQTRIVSPIRDTGEGTQPGDTGSRIEKVLQKCFDPNALKPLTRKKQEATRICRNFGTKVETLNAWAVPVERTQDLLNQLGKIEADWEVLAKDLADNIQSSIDKWAKANPSEAETIRKLAPTCQDVIASTRFIKTSYRLRGEDVDDDGCLEGELTGMAGQTMRELAQSLRDASLDKASGGQYTQSVKDVLKRVQVKAESLAFLDPRLEEVSTVLQSTLDTLPASGLITSASAILIKSVVDQMLNPGLLMKNGFNKIGQSEATTAAPAQAKPVKVPAEKKGKPVQAKPVQETPVLPEPVSAPVQHAANLGSALPSAALSW